MATTPPENELHELEQSRQAGIPNECHGHPEDVTVERKVNGDLPIVSTDGQLIGPFADASEKIARGEGQFRGLLFPFTVMTKRRGKVEIRRNSRFFFEDHDLHVRADTVRVDEDGRLYATFKETGARYPKRSWTFMTRDIAEYIEQERLRSDAEVNENAEAALESLTEEA